MKPNPFLRSFLFISGSALLAATFSHADDGTWIATAAGPFNWSDTANWADTNADTIGDVADGTGFTAFFTPNIIANQAVTVDSVRTIGNITFTDSTTSSNNLAIGGANMLTLDVSTGVSLIDVTQTGRTLTISAPVTVNDGLQKNGAGALTFSGPITLAGTQTWTNNSAAALTTGNVANLITNGGFDLTVDATGTTNFGVINNAGVALSGSGALVKNGTGRLNVGGINSGFTGAVTVNGGVLHVYNDGAALGNGNLTLNGGVLSFYWGATYTRTLGTSTSQVQILGGESGVAGSGTTGPAINLGSTVRWGAAGEGAVDLDPGATGFFNPSKFVLGDPGTSNAATVTFASAIDLNGATRTIVVPGGGGNRSTISGAISNGTGTSNLIKEGTGMLILSNASLAWAGTTTISGGIVDFGGNNLASIGGGAGRNITVAAGAGVRFNAASNALLTRLAENSNEIAVMSGTTANNLDFSSSTGANLPNAFLGNFASNGAKMTYSGTLTPASDNYRFGAKGSAGLLGITGTLTGTQGIIVGGTGSSGIRVNLVAANTHTGDTVINTGSRLTLGHNLALQNSPLSVGAAGGNFSCAAGTNAGRITGETAAPSPTFGGLKGSRNLLTVFSNGAGNNETNLAATAVTGFTLNPGTGVTCSYTGVIANFAPLTTLTKTGEGTQEFTNTQTYTGATTVSGGTLSLGTTGSITASASVTIGAGATLDTSGQATYVVPAAQPLAFGIDAAGTGSAGKIATAGLDIEDAVVTFNIVGTPDDAVYVLATYTSLTGTAFASPLPTPPAGYTLDYAYQTNKIALVSSGGDVTPPTLTSIVDDVGGGSVNIGQIVTYTVTFDEDMDDMTVAAADFGNDGSAGVSIGAVTETTPGVFSVPVTTNGPGTLILRINLNAGLKDVAGNNLDTDPALLDGDTITVRNAYQTWAAVNAIGSTPEQDKDGDGVSNAVEFLLGGDVTTNDIGKLPEITTPGTNMEITFERKRSTIDTITGCTIQVGTTLASWPDVYTVGTNTGNSTAGVAVLENTPSGFDTITLTVPRSPDANKFARLNVVVTP